LTPGKPGPFVYSGKTDLFLYRFTASLISFIPIVFEPASKTLAERKAHEFANENPSISVTSLNPPMIYSPPLQSITSKSEINTSSNAIYSLINGEEGRECAWNRLPLFCSTQDVAKAHRRAIEVDVEKVRGKRVSPRTEPPREVS